MKTSSLYCNHSQVSVNSDSSTLIIREVMLFVLRSYLAAMLLNQGVSQVDQRARVLEITKEEVSR
jgi:hypothetical protein